jgi:hypothetical protein
MDTIEQLLEKITAVTYGNEFMYTRDIFVFVDKVIKDDLLNTFRFEENKKELESNITSVMISISREIIQELKESKYDISHTTEIKDGEVIDTYFDRKKSKILSSMFDAYSANDLLLYHNKILQETVDFIGKNEVLNLFYKAYLQELAFEAVMETHNRRNMDALLDLFNDPRYKEVREGSILPALSDRVAEQLPLNELKFKNIEEATQAYKKDETLETLVQLKKLHMIEVTKKTENCYDHEELAKMLHEAELDCVRRIIIRRLAYLDVTNS